MWVWMGGWTIALKAFWQIEIKGLILCRWDQKVTFAQSYIFLRILEPSFPAMSQLLLLQLKFFLSSSFLDGKDYRWAPESVLPRNSLNLVSHTVTAVMLLACVFLRRTIARMRGLNVDNRELELTSNCTIPEISRGRRHASSSESNFSTSPASSTLPLPDFHQPHSHVNRSYTNTYSSCSSFKLPNIIGMYVMNKQVTSSPDAAYLCYFCILLCT